MEVLFDEIDIAKKISVVRLIGRLDAHNAPMVQSKIDEFLEDGKEHKLVVNMSEVEYISSGGIRIMVRLVKHIRRIGGELTLCDLQVAVSDVFEMVGFDTFFSIYKSEKKAIDSFLS